MSPKVAQGLYIFKTVIFGLSIFLIILVLIAGMNRRGSRKEKDGSFDASGIMNGKNPKPNGKPPKGNDGDNGVNWGGGP